MGFNRLPKRVTQKVLTHAGIPFELVWTINATIEHNPYKDKDELSVDWLSVDYYLEQIHVITMQITRYPKNMVKHYLLSIP